MSDPIILRIFEIVGSSLCVASDDGQKVFDQISQALNDREKITLSFQNVDTLTSAFLNTAIGQLYGAFSEEEIKKHLSVIEIDDNDLILLKRVIDTAKLYFKDPAVINAIRSEELGDVDE